MNTSESETMTLEDWFLAATEEPEGLYLRGGWANGEWAGPDDRVSLEPGELIVFEVDDGRNDRRITARWNGQYITLI